MLTRLRRTPRLPGSGGSFPLTNSLPRQPTDSARDAKVSSTAAERALACSPDLASTWGWFRGDQLCAPLACTLARTATPPSSAVTSNCSIGRVAALCPYMIV